MENINQHLANQHRRLNEQQNSQQKHSDQQATGSAKSTTNSADDAETEQKRLKVDQFYAKLRSVYGKAKYDSQFANTEDLNRSKRTWADDINELTSTQYKLGFAELQKKMKNGDQEYQWPDIGKVIGLCTRSERQCAAHKLFLPQKPREVTPEQRARGSAALAELKQTLGMR